MRNSRRAVYGLLAAALAATGLGQTAWAEDKDLFDRLDAGGDGFITADEVGGEQKRLFERLLRTADSNEDGKLSREEFVAGTNRRPAAAEGGVGVDREAARRSLEDALKRMDANGDQKLSKDEVPERLRERFDSVDTSGDGFLDATELRAAFAGGTADRPQGGPGVKPGTPEFEQFARRIFRERDANGDEKLTIDEIPAERREGFERILEKFDDDGDKAITAPQFAQALAALMGRGQPQPTAAAPRQPGLEFVLARLKEADENGDGKLSRAEVIERAGQLFDRLDASGDGQLDEREVRAALGRLLENAPQLRDRLGERKKPSP